MRYDIFLILAGIAFQATNTAGATTIVFDWSTEPEASNFDDVSSASTTVDGVTLSAAMIGGGTFNISSSPQALGAAGIGSNQQWDGEAGFTFSFDSPGTLTSITLEGEFTPSWNLATPNDGTNFYTTDFAGESFSFLSGQVFSFNRTGGAFRVGTIVIELPPIVPEPSSLALLTLGSLFLLKRRRATGMA